MDHINELPEAAAAERLSTCLRSTAWVRAMLAGRPYAGVEDLTARAVSAARDLDDDALAEALAAHPRIGDRPEGPGPEAALSRAEQAGVGDDEAVQAELRRVNEAYEARFGHVFLVRAAGRDATEILAVARERLGHDLRTEGRVVREQLGEIAVLRLRDLLTREGG